MSTPGTHRSDVTELGDLHPDLSSTRMVTLPFHIMWLLPLWRLILRAVGSSPVSEVDIEDRAAADVPVRVYRPQTDKSGAALLWMHGGGLILGSPTMDDLRCSELARDLGIVVVSVDYRLAPEHPFPAAIDDAATVWHWMQDTAGELGIDKTRVAVGGESAGAGLAACLAQRVKDQGDTQPAAQLLIYPMLDDRTAARRDLDDAGNCCWDNRSNRAGWSAYLGESPGGQRMPEYAVAARRDDLEGLAPTWIGVGLLDLFLGECREYAMRLERAGVPTTLLEVPGAPHGFLAFAPSVPLSRAFVASQIDFLRSHLGGAQR